jgi:hypothetical protein
MDSYVAHHLQPKRKQAPIFKQVEPTNSIQVSLALLGVVYKSFVAYWGAIIINCIIAGPAIIHILTKACNSITRNADWTESWV